MRNALPAYAPAYPPGMDADDARDVTPLAWPALRALDGSLTASALVERFAGLRARIDLETARELLDELSRLGLARVASSDHGDPVYVATSLGARMRGTASPGVPDMAGTLADLERLRTDLLATIAHELRTPLTAIRTCVGILLEPSAKPTAEERLTLLDTIARNADRMQRLVADVLDLARFRAGQVQLQLRRFDAVELAGGGLATIEPVARARRVAVELETPGAPVKVFGDHRRLEQALLNLLSNAVKFSSEGGRVEVRVAGDEREVAWSVADHGPGIRPEDHARLFERFFVGRSDRSEAAAGTGLGLPTALAIAQAHGGRIDVESEVGRGSTFRLAVPTHGPEGMEA